MRTSNVLQLLIESFGALGGDEGILFGDREQEVTGIQVCWMASLDAIEHARKGWGQSHNRPRRPLLSVVAPAKQLDSGGLPELARQPATHPVCSLTMESR